MAQTPLFVDQVDLWTTRLTTEVLDRSGSGAALQIGTAYTKGFLVYAAWCWPSGDYSANVLRFFRRKAGSVVYNPILEFSVQAVSGSSNTAAIARQNIPLPDVLSPTGSFGLLIGPTDELWVAHGTSSATALNVILQGGAYTT